MTAASRLHWGRIVLGALLVEVVLLVVLVPISFVNQAAFLVAVPIGCLVLPYLVTRWLLRRVSGPVLHGTLIGVLSTAIYFGLVFSQPGGLSSVIAIYGVVLFWTINALRIAGCVLGGLHAGHRKAAGAAHAV